MYFKNRFLIIVFLFLFIFAFSIILKDDHVENLGIFGLSRIKAVAGQDGCSSIAVNKNVMMWTFGDTILGRWKEELTVETTFEESAEFKGMIHNSIAFTKMPDDDNIINLNFKFVGERGMPVDFIKHKENEDKKKWRFWAVDGIRVNNSIFVYYMIINLENTSKNIPFNFNGMGLSRWDIAGSWEIGDKVQFKRIGKIFSKDEPSFGDSVIEKDGFLYLTGHRRDVNKIYAYIAKVSPGRIAFRDGYSFLKSDGSWTDNINESSGLFGDVFGEFSISYNKMLKSFILIYCGSGGNIKLVKFGSFEELYHTRPRVIYKPPRLPRIKTRLLYFYYSGKEIFYSKNSIYAVYINPAIYQPILLRIPYRVINGSSIF